MDYTADLFELVLGNLQGAPETKPISEETYLRHFLLTTFSFNLFQENEKLFQMFEIADRNMFTFEFYLKHLKKVLQFFGNRALQSLRIFDWYIKKSKPSNVFCGNFFVAIFFIWDFVHGQWVFLGRIITHLKSFILTC